MLSHIAYAYLFVSSIVLSLTMLFIMSAEYSPLCRCRSRSQTTLLLILCPAPALPRTRFLSHYVFAFALCFSKIHVRVLSLTHSSIVISTVSSFFYTLDRFSGPTDEKGIAFKPSALLRQLFVVSVVDFQKDARAFNVWSISGLTFVRIFDTHQFPVFLIFLSDKEDDDQRPE